MRILVVSDTHAPRRWRGIPPELLPDLEGADAILHAGDVCVPEVLDAFAQFAPVHVVLGNNDGDAVAAWRGSSAGSGQPGSSAPDAGVAETWQTEWAGVRLAMVHDSGAKAGRAARMRRLFPDADLVVFGHSHLPWDTREGGLHLFNPGSLCDPRRHPWPSYGVLDLDAGTVRSTIVPLPRR